MLITRHSQCSKKHRLHLTEVCIQITEVRCRFCYLSLSENVCRFETHKCVCVCVGYNGSFVRVMSCGCHLSVNYQHVNVFFALLNFCLYIMILHQLMMPNSRCTMERCCKARSLRGGYVRCGVIKHHHLDLAASSFSFLPRGPGSLVVLVL